MSICDWSGMGDYGVCVMMRMIASKRNGRRGRGSGRTMWCRTKVSHFPPVRGGNCWCDRKKDEVDALELDCAEHQAAIGRC